MSTPTPESAAAVSGPREGGSVPDGDSAQWFTAEVHPNDAPLKAYLRSSFPSVRDVDDVVQEAYLRIWKARARHPIHSAKAFLFRIARHLALDSVKRDRRFVGEAGCDFAAHVVLDSSPNAAEVALTQDLLGHLSDALVAIPARYRNVVVLHKLKGMPLKEVASHLNLTLRTTEKYSMVGIDLCAAYLRTKGIHHFFG